MTKLLLLAVTVMMCGCAENSRCTVSYPALNVQIDRVDHKTCVQRMIEGYPIHWESWP